MINIGRWLVYWLWTILMFRISALYLVFSGEESWPQYWKHVRVWAWGSLKIFGIKLEVIGHEKGLNSASPTIFISNHRSWLDQIIIIYLLKRPMHVYSKRAYFKIPVLGWALKKTLTIPVDRDTSQRPSPVEMGVYRVRQEHDLLIFPEGTRGTGETLMRFKNGAFQIAKDGHAKVQAMHIIGAEYRLSKLKPLLSLSPGKVVVIFEDPVAEPNREAFFEKYAKAHEEAWLKFGPSCRIS